MRRLIIIVVLLALLFVGNTLYSSRPRTVKLTYAVPNAPKLTIYRSGDDHLTELTKLSEAILTVTASQDIQLKKGSYLIESEDSNDYGKILQPFIVDGDNTSVTVEPVFSQSKLTNLLVTEQPAIDTAMKSHFKSYQPTTQNISQHVLYARGEWASVVVTTNGSQDYYHVILKKQDNAWQVLTKASIILSAPAYPQIPRDILIEVNKNQFVDTRERS